MNIEFDDENKIKIKPEGPGELESDHTGALETEGQNPLAEEESIEEDDRGGDIS